MSHPRCDECRYLPPELGLVPSWTDALLRCSAVERQHRGYFERRIGGKPVVIVTRQVATPHIGAPRDLSIGGLRTYIGRVEHVHEAQIGVVVELIQLAVDELKEYFPMLITPYPDLKVLGRPARCRLLLTFIEERRLLRSAVDLRKRAVAAA